MTMFLFAALLLTPPRPQLAFDPRPQSFRIEQLVDEKGEPQASGYLVTLTRPAAERLADLLDEYVDEERLAKAMDSDIKQLKNRLFFFFAKKNFKQLKLDLREKLGAEGVRITVTGNRPLDMLDADRTAEEKAEARRRERAIQTLLPGKLKTLHSMVNTVPGKWKVEPVGEPAAPPAKAAGR